MTTFQFALIGSLMACAVTTAGIFTISRFEKWASTYAIYFMSFAAGILLAASFLHLIPEAARMNAHAPYFVLAGFMGMFVLSHIIGLHDGHQTRRGARKVGLLFITGVGFHSLLDGLLYSVTFSVNMLTGVLTATGMVLHEFPEGVVTFVILNRDFMNRRKSFILAFATAAATTPVGTLVSYPFIRLAGRQELGILLALSAGALTYVGASHLLPIVEEQRKPLSLLALGLGVLLIVMVLLVKET